METPVLLRGKFYTTHLARKCPNFCACVACKKCTKFNQHNAMCQTCEHGQNYKCTHTEKQKSTFIQIEMKLKRPLFEVDAKVDHESSQKQYVEETELTELESALGGLGVTAQNVI